MNTDRNVIIKDKALIVGIQYKDGRERDDEYFVRSHMAELKSLCETMGLAASAEALVKLRAPQSRYLIGTGRAEELIALAGEQDCSLIVFDEDLSPSQQRNWEELSGLCVIDRQEVILEIFASRAKTREAVLQVALARLEYSLPRLTRAWTHLSRQRGGARGTKGEGETQLESDRRIIVRKIAAVKQELETVKRYRAVQRKQRQTVPVPVVSLVGYTNAGKSSLLNSLTGAEVLVEDKLFATLDPTTRRIKFQSGTEFLLSDTVGFIRKLPHTLIESFNSTLEEVLKAELLLHVLDASNPDFANQYATTRMVLEQIGAGEKPALTVFNKTDLLQDPLDSLFIRKRFPEALFVSAINGQGLTELVDAVDSILLGSRRLVRLSIPQDRWDLVALLHRQAQILEETCVDSIISIQARLADREMHKFYPYIVQEEHA